MKAFIEPAYLPAFKSARAPRSLSDSLRRFRRMPWSEIAGRSRQEAAKLVDRMTTGDRAINPAAILRDHAPAYVNASAALGILRKRAPSRFFAGVDRLDFAVAAVPGQREA